VPADQPVTASPAQLERRLEARGPARWKVPLGAVLIERLMWLDSDRVYVALRADSQKLENLDHLVLDGETGRILWRRERSQRDGRYRILYATSDLLLFAVDRPNGARTVEALDVATGNARWAMEQRRPRRGEPTPPILVDDAGDEPARLVLIEGTRAQAVDVTDGTVLWRRKLGSSGGAGGLQSNGSVLWDANGGVFSRVRLSDGGSVWDSRIEVADHVQPQAEDGRVYVATPDSGIAALRADDGSTVWRTRLPGGAVVNSLQLGAGSLFVRGHEESDGRSRPVTMSLDLDTGALRWTHHTATPSLSNLIEEDGVVYHATASEVYALDAATGKERFATPVTDTGRSFPVHLRLMEDHVVYIGELLVAGVERSTGTSIFHHGLTPISPETSLNALDVSIPRLKEALEATQSSGSSFTVGESQRYQTLSNSYARQAQSYRTQAFMASSSGNTSMADSARFRSMEAQSAANRASRHAETMATVEMSLSIMNLASQLQEVWKAAGIQSTIERQQLFRDSIVSGYTLSENDRYVYRPHSRYRSADDHFSGVQVMDLNTGRRAFTYLSPSYRAYGLWNLVDFEKGLVIHHGVGLQPDQYHYSELRRMAPRAPKIRTVESYLIASPIRMP
tara:strand:- start:6453 stop:8321 length:1869 start_codon:yes stop_codon:yes gene_type:complete